MARRITLTRDERILMAAAIANTGHQPGGARPVNVAHVITKLQHRGLLDEAGDPTDLGRRAHAEARHTTPKTPA